MIVATRSSDCEGVSTRISVVGRNYSAEGVSRQISVAARGIAVGLGFYEVGRQKMYN